MQSPYANNESAQGYLDFLESDDGKTFQKALSEAVFKRLNGFSGLVILDAGCGPGWLTNILASQGHNVQGCDISPQLIKKAKSAYPNLDFEICDLTKNLPYQNKQFNCVILSLSALDLNNQRAAYLEINRVMRQDGRLIIITINPYYGFPVGVWKRGFIGRLEMKKPALKLMPYFGFVRAIDRSFKWYDNKLTSYFYTLPEQINLLLDLGFKLNHLADLRSENDDKKYSLKYRLFRFPIFILMEFVKD